MELLELLGAQRVLQLLDGHRRASRSCCADALEHPRALLRCALTCDCRLPSNCTGAPIARTPGVACRRAARSGRGTDTGRPAARSGCSLRRVAQNQGGHRREVSLTSRHRWRRRLQQAAFSIGAVLISIASGAAGLRGHRLRPMRKSQARAPRTSRRREPRRGRAMMSSGAVPAARRERARSSVTRARALGSVIG